MIIPKLSNLTHQVLGFGLLSPSYSGAYAQPFSDSFFEPFGSLFQCKFGLSLSGYLRFGVCWILVAARSVRHWRIGVWCWKIGVCHLVFVNLWLRGVKALLTRSVHDASPSRVSVGEGGCGEGGVLFEILRRAGGLVLSWCKGSGGGMRGVSSIGEYGDR